MVSFFFLQAGPLGWGGGGSGWAMPLLEDGGTVSGTGWFVREGSITHKAIHKVASELHSWKSWRVLSSAGLKQYDMSRSPWTREARKVTRNCRDSR